MPRPPSETPIELSRIVDAGLLSSIRLAAELMDMTVAEYLARALSMRAEQRAAESIDAGRF